MKRKLQDLYYDTLCPICSISILKDKEQKMCEICYDFKLLTNSFYNIILEENQKKNDINK